MARNTPVLGLKVWNLNTDPYSHSDLAANWDAIDAQAGKSGKAIQNVSNLTVGSAGGPASPLNTGDLVMTNTSLNTFPAWTLLRWDGATWENVGPIEVQSSVPASNLYTGRLVYLAAASGSFNANTIIGYNGAAWDYVGFLTAVNTGAGATNIQGAQTSGDIYINSGARGIVFTDRISGTKYRIYFSNGAFLSEIVT